MYVFHMFEINKSINQINQTVANIQTAKKLRKSDNLFVQANVFMNANQTIAEAEVRFEIREHRRHTVNAQRRVGQN